MTALLCALTCPSALISSGRDQLPKRPVSYGIILDNSQDLQTELPQFKAAATQIINSNTSIDETLIVFSDKGDGIGVFPELRTGKLSDNKTDLADFLQDLKSVSGRKPLLDELFLSADFLTRNRASSQYRRALVLLTDGKDKGSYYQRNQVFTLLQTEVPVFILNVTRAVNKQKPDQKAINFVQEIAAKSGGKVFVADHNSKIDDVTKALIAELRSK